VLAAAIITFASLLKKPKPVVTEKPPSETTQNAPVTEGQDIPKP
jgi:hypothetical protein